MWAAHPELQSQRLRILGSDVQGVHFVNAITITANLVSTEVYEKFATPPPNFVKKGRDCLRFTIWLSPTSVSVTRTSSIEGGPAIIDKLGELRLAISAGRYIYDFHADRLDVGNFTAHKFRNVVDSNFTDSGR